MEKNPESLVRLQLHILNNSLYILQLQQCGFCVGHSTVTAAGSVTDHIVSSLDEKLLCAAFFNDHSKAFDTINH